jgi:CO/xanthine dehydrogenase Mo-binding subunit
VRQGGATAREMLIQAAADGWKVPAAECSAANSVITHKPTGRTTTYGKVAEAAAKVTPPRRWRQGPKDWKLIGKPVKRLDTLPKVIGAQVYGADLKLPGMLNAAIKDCPVFGGKVKRGEAAFAATVAASGLPADKCEVYKINLGGGFGRRGAFHDYVTQAVQIAKQVPGTPIKLLWSREEDMLHGRYHPVMQSKLTGAFDAGSNLTGLHMRLSGQSILTAVFPQNLVNGMDALTFQGLHPKGDFQFGYSGRRSRR